MGGIDHPQGAVKEQTTVEEKLFNRHVIISGMLRNYLVSSVEAVKICQ